MLRWCRSIVQAVRPLPRRGRFLLAAVLLGLALFAAPQAQAGIVFLSGDGNITDGLVGTPTPGNQQFFSNVLGAGDKVVIGAGSTISSFSSNVNSYYNSLGGVTSSILGGPVTAADLAGAELFFGILPSSDYTASEIAALSSFLAGGGRVFFIGENGFFPGENGRINAALAALGSGMSIIPDSTFDSGFQTATGSQIATDPFTAGITSFLYAAPSQVLVDGGTALFFGTGGQPFITYQNIGGTPGVPEPGSLTLLGMGVVGAGTYFWRRRRPAES